MYSVVFLVEVLMKSKHTGSGPRLGAMKAAFSFCFMFDSQCARYNSPYSFSHLLVKFGYWLSASKDFSKLLTLMRPTRLLGSPPLGGAFFK